MSWKIVKIGSVLKQYRIEHWVQNDKMYKQVSILNDGSVVLRGEKIGKEIGRKRQFLIDTDKYPKTLIFTRQLLLQGSIGIASSDVNGCIVTENMPMFSIEGIEIDFLTFFIKTKLFKSQVKNLETSGTAQKSLHERQFLDLEIPLPTLKEQNKIITLCKLGKNNFEKINKEISQQQFHLQLLRQAILQEAVQGKLTQQNKTDEPADKLLQRIKAEKQKLIAAGKLKKEKELPPITKDDLSTVASAKVEIPFELPKGWAWCRIGEIADIGTGGTPLTSTTEYYNGNIPWITSSATGSLFVSDAEKFITEKAVKETNCKVYPIGTLIVAMYGQGKTRGQVTELLIEAATNQACASIELIIKEKHHKEYVKYFFQKIYLEIRELAAGGAQPNLNLQKIKETTIPLPPLREQHRIVTKVQQLLQMANQLEQQVAHSQTQAQQLLQAVLKEAFSLPSVASATEGKGKLYEENEMITMAAEE